MKIILEFENYEHLKNFCNYISYFKGHNFYLFFRKLLNKFYHIKCQSCFDYRASEIHHIDKNRKNNDYNNLMFLCKQCHIDQHYGRGEMSYKDYFRATFRIKI